MEYKINTCKEVLTSTHRTGVGVRPPGCVTNIYLGGVHEEHLYVCLSIGGADEAARGGAAAATSYMVAFDNRLS